MLAYPLSMDQAQVSGDPPVPQPGRSVRRWLTLEHAAYLLAALFAVPSLFYPIGGDTAVYDYVARRWVEGLWPYRHAVEHKPPGIFVANAVAPRGKSVWRNGCQEPS